MSLLKDALKKAGFKESEKEKPKKTFKKREEKAISPEKKLIHTISSERLVMSAE